MAGDQAISIVPTKQSQTEIIDMKRNTSSGKYPKTHTAVGVCLIAMAAAATAEQRPRELYDIGTQPKSSYNEEVFVDISCKELLKHAAAQSGYPQSDTGMMTLPEMQQMMAAALQQMSDAEKQKADAKQVLHTARQQVDAAKPGKPKADAEKALADAEASMVAATTALSEAADAVSLATLAKKRSADEIAIIANARAATKQAEQRRNLASSVEEIDAARKAEAAAAGDAAGETDTEATMTVQERGMTDLVKLEQRAADVRYLRRVWDSLGAYPSRDWDFSGASVTRGDKLLSIRKEISTCAQRAVLQAQKAAALPSTIDSPTIDQQLVQSTLDAAKEDYFHVAKRTLFDQSQLGLFIGPSYSLDSGDKFETGVETLALFDGGAGSLFGVGRAITEISYRSNGSLNFAGQIPAEPSASEPPAAALTERDLYRADPGYARINIGGSTAIADRYSLALVGGLTALPGLNDSFPKALRPRGEFTVLGRSFYGQGVYSRISAGYAYDTYWRNAVVANRDNLRDGTTTEKSYNRAIVQALVMLPMPGVSPEFAVAGRLSVDTPINGDGPSEVRLSILASMDFARFFASLTPQSGASGN